MIRLDALGFKSWVSEILSFAQQNAIMFDDNSDTKKFRVKTKKLLVSSFQDKWFKNINDRVNFPILRTYCQFKQNFQFEPYLLLIPNVKHRKALTRLRCSSHHLAIETGRWQKPKIPEKMRLCKSCRVVENEIHFFCHCRINRCERAKMKNELLFILGTENFLSLHDDFFLNTLTSTEAGVLRAIAKFVYQSFLVREES